MKQEKKAIAPKSSQSCLNCKAEIERVLAQIAKAEKDLSLLRLSNKFYTDKDLDRKNKLQFHLEDLRSLHCELKTASKFEVGMWVKNGTPTPGEVKGLYLVDSHPRVAVLYDGKEEVKHERPAQLTLVDQDYLEYIWTGEDYAKLIRRGDKKECVDLEVLAENFISAINTRDTHKDCEAEPEDIELYNRQAIWCKKQYQKITCDLFPAGTKVQAKDLIGTVLPYSERNPAYLQKVEVKLDDDSVKQFYPTEIDLLPSAVGSLPSRAKPDKTKIIEFCPKPTIQTIAISDIRRNGGTQQRTALNHEVVKEYAEAMRHGDKFPPVKLKYDDTNYWLTDGFHTTEAAWSIGKTEIEAEVSKGSQREAILDSVGVNSNHGLRRSNADKRRAVTTLLNDPEWGQWSDREIARRCKVSQPFVSKLRGELTDNVISHNPKNDNEIITDNVISHNPKSDIKVIGGEIPSDNQRKYKDRYGNTSMMNTENIGSDNKQELLTIKPKNINNATENNASDNKTISKTAVQPPTFGKKKLVENFEVGQIVIIDSDRSDKRLIGHNKSYGVITAVNPASVNLKLFGHLLTEISPNDIKPVDEFFQPTVCLSVSQGDMAKLLIGFDSKEEIIKAAIAARSLNLQN